MIVLRARVYVRVRAFVFMIASWFTWDLIGVNMRKKVSQVGGLVGGNRRIKTSQSFVERGGTVTKQNMLLQLIETSSLTHFSCNNCVRQ